MKIGIKIVFAFIIVGCSSVNLTNSWKNPKHQNFNPTNILVVSVSPNFETRSDSEFKFVTELNARNINAIQSTVVFKKLFQDTQQTESEIEAQIDKLLTVGYDTVLISQVKNVQENESRTGASPKFDYKLRKFLGGYLTSQDDYFEQDYYKKYKVLYIETAIYSLHKDAEKSLVWTGTYTLIDPSDIKKRINTYVKAVMKSMEKEGLVAKK
jgi:hypothetical protein